MYKISADIKVDLNKIYNEKINANVRLYGTTTLAKMLDPYVPFKYGILSRTVKLTPHSIIYTQPYSKRLYYGKNFNFTKDFHPLATHNWLLPVKTNNTAIKELTRAIERYMKL